MSEEYRGFTIHVRRTTKGGRVGYSAEALHADYPKLWSFVFTGPGSKNSASMDIRKRIREAIKERGA